MTQSPTVERTTHKQHHTIIAKNREEDKCRYHTIPYYALSFLLVTRTNPSIDLYTTTNQFSSSIVAS